LSTAGDMSAEQIKSLFFDSGSVINPKSKKFSIDLTEFKVKLDKNGEANKLMAKVKNEICQTPPPKTSTVQPAQRVVTMVSKTLIGK
jgi:hypothetical protein